MIADVAFDVPLSRPFSYSVPENAALAPGQRVLAPLKGAARVGVVVALREGETAALKSLLRVLDPAPVLAAAQLDLAAWIATESLTSLGSTCLALMPPLERPAMMPPRSRSMMPEVLSDAPMPKVSAAPSGTSGSDADPGGTGGREPSETPSLRPTSPRVLVGSRRVTIDAGPVVEEGSRPPRAHEATLPEVLIGAGRETMLLETIAAARAPVLVLTADLDSAARWAQRLAKLDVTVRLDSGVAEAERAAAWRALATGTARLAVGTRAALLAPLPRGATTVLIDEHEAAHKPPGPPHIHAREVVLERSAREGLRAVLTAATPSVETWWLIERGRARLATPGPVARSTVVVADTRGIAKREALTPALARAIRETLAAGRRVFLVVSRLTSALGCDECGAILTCAACAIALAYSPAGRTLTCRLCGASRPLADTCGGCGGRRLTPFGWGAERVEHAVRRRFVRARIARYDPDAGRGRKAEGQRAAALAADVVIGTRGALRLFGPASLGLAAFISPDQLLGLPDFRAAERTFALMWAAGERVRPDGQLVVQSQNPGHYAVDAVVKQDPSLFYRRELSFRAELGYPPFRRLAIAVARGPEAAQTARLAQAFAEAVRGLTGVIAYPPAPDRRQRTWRVVVKGGADLPRLLASVLDTLGAAGRPRSRGIMDVEIDPVEWPS